MKFSTGFANSYQQFSHKSLDDNHNVTWFNKVPPSMKGRGHDQVIRRVKLFGRQRD